MRTLHTALIASGLALGLVVCVPGCKKKNKSADDTAQQADQNQTPPDQTPPDQNQTPPDQNQPPKSGDGSGTGTGTGMGGGGGGTGMTNKMANCPSAAPGAMTKVEQTKKAVVVTVTAKDKKDKAAVAEIQKRAKLLSGLDANADTDIKHTGKGTGGGGLGKCPVVMSDVTLKVKNQKDGAAITLTPKDAAKLGDLAKTAKDRADALASMPAAGAGGDMDKDKDDKGAAPAGAK